MSDIQIEEPTGVINGSNTLFQVDHPPKYITINGLQYFEGDGYSISKVVITMNVPPEEGSTIRSIYQ